MMFRAIQSSLLLAASLTMLTACGPEFTADASTEGPFLRVDIRKLKDGDRVKVAGRSEVAEGSKMQLYFPAEQAGEGKKKLEIEVERKGRSSTKKIEVNIRAEALEPFLRVGGCVNPKKKDDAGSGLKVSVASAVWTKSNKNLFKASSKEIEKGSCKVHEDNTIRMHVTANTDAKVKIGGKKVSLKEGHGRFSFPLPNVLGQATLNDLVKSGYDQNDLDASVEAEVSRDGQTKKHQLAFSVRRTQARDALVSSFADFSTGKKFPWPRSDNDGKPRGLVMFTERANVEVSGQPREIRHQGFSNPIAVAADDVRVDQLDLVARAIPSDVTRRASCTGYVTITGYGSVRNVGFKMGFDVIVHDHTGKVVAQRNFPKPRRTKCPSTLSGRQGETTVLVWVPEKEEIVRWLESVRSGKKYVPKPKPGRSGGWMQTL